MYQEYLTMIEKIQELEFEKILFNVQKIKSDKIGFIIFSKRLFNAYKIFTNDTYRQEKKQNNLYLRDLLYFKGLLINQEKYFPNNHAQSILTVESVLLELKNRNNCLYSPLQIESCIYLLKVLRTVLDKQYIENEIYDSIQSLYYLKWLATFYRIFFTVLEKEYPEEKVMHQCLGEIQFELNSKISMSCDENKASQENRLKFFQKNIREESYYNDNFLKKNVIGKFLSSKVDCKRDLINLISRSDSIKGLSQDNSKLWLTALGCRFSFTGNQPCFSKLIMDIQYINYFDDSYTFFLYEFFKDMPDMSNLNFNNRDMLTVDLKKCVDDIETQILKFTVRQERHAEGSTIDDYITAIQCRLSNLLEIMHCIELTVFVYLLNCHMVSLISERIDLQIQNKIERRMQEIDTMFGIKVDTRYNLNTIQAWVLLRNISRNLLSILSLDNKQEYFILKCLTYYICKNPSSFELKRYKTQNSQDNYVSFCNSSLFHYKGRLYYKFDSGTDLYCTPYNESKINFGGVDKNKWQELHADITDCGKKEIIGSVYITNPLQPKNPSILLANNAGQGAIFQMGVVGKSQFSTLYNLFGMPDRDNKNLDGLQSIGQIDSTILALMFDDGRMEVFDTKNNQLSENLDTMNFIYSSVGGFLL